jgi:hypothetical protein
VSAAEQGKPHWRGFSQIPVLSCSVVDPFWFFNADPDPAFYLHAEPDPDPESQTNVDPDPGQT